MYEASAHSPRKVTKRHGNAKKKVVRKARVASAGNSRAPAAVLLRAHMRRHKLTQMNVAAMMVVNQSTVSRILRGVGLEVETERKLSKFLGVSTDALRGIVPTNLPRQTVTVLGEIGWCPPESVVGSTNLWEEEERYDISYLGTGQMPAGELVAYVTQDPAMNARFDMSRRLTLICAPIGKYRQPIKTGSYVIVAHKIETASVWLAFRQLIIDDGGNYWAWPRSTESEWQHPVHIPRGGKRQGTVWLHAVVLEFSQSLLPD